MQNRKGMRKGMNVAVIATLAMSMLMFGITGVFISISGQVQHSVFQTQCVGGSAGYNTTTGACNVGATTVASNITGQAMSGTWNASQQLPLLGTIIGLSAVLLLLLGLFMWKKGGKGGF